jgi:hypothetical protein
MPGAGVRGLRARVQVGGEEPAGHRVLGAKKSSRRGPPHHLGCQHVADQTPEPGAMPPVP